MTREDGYKYEWLDGFIEKSTYSLNTKNLFIIANLQNIFFSSLESSKINEVLVSGGDTFFGKHHRRPDIAYYTDKQIADAANDLDAVPLFVIEIISSKDQIIKVHHKMQDFRNAGVSIVWHIFPELKEVHVYTKKANQMKVLKGENFCSAEPVIKGFKISLDDIFKK